MSSPRVPDAATEAGAGRSPDLVIREVARAAYLYGLPTVDLYKILLHFALDPASAEFKAPPNAFFHSRALADPSDRSIVAMNVDTPYSYAWLDLRAEPVVLTMPSFESDRYVSAELLDLYTYIVGYVSPRTNGNGGGNFLVAGPGWIGEVPLGCTRFAARRSSSWCSCGRSCSTIATWATSSRSKTRWRCGPCRS